MAAVPSIGRASGIQPRPVAAPEADATRALYERYSRQIYNYCIHQLSSREEAEDAVQTTFMNAFRGLKRGVVPQAEQAWLFKIAENVCLSRRRSSWRRGRVESPNDFEVLQEIVPSQHNRRADELIGLDDALGAMPESQRRAILLREWQGLSYREIADELELSQAAVETLIFRARRSLAQGLEQPPAPKKGRLRRAGQGLNLGSFVAGLKALLTGGAAAKAVAVAVAAGTVTIAATKTAPAVHHRHPAAPRHAAVVPEHSAAAFSPRASRAALSPAAARVHTMAHPARNTSSGHGKAAAAPVDEGSPASPPAPSAPAASAPTTAAPTSGDDSQSTAAPAPATPHGDGAPATPKKDAPNSDPPSAQAKADVPKADPPKAQTADSPSPGSSGEGNTGGNGGNGGNGNGNEKKSDPAPAPSAGSGPPVPTTNAPMHGNGNGNGGSSGNAGANGGANSADAADGKGK